MTLAWSTDTTIDPGEPVGIGRWTASLLAVVLVHAVAIVALLSWRSPVPPLEPPAAAVMIELAPVPAPTPGIQPPKPPEPEVIKEALPEPVVVPPKPAVVLPPPKPKPKPTSPRVEQPAPSQVEPAPPRPSEPVAAAPVPVAAPPVATSTYQGLLLSHLERNKRYPREARMRRQEGVATLRFSIDRTGRLLAFKLERSAGHAILDDEVLALIQRAAPLPPFPPEMTEPRFEFVVPVRFALR